MNVVRTTASAIIRRSYSAISSTHSAYMGEKCVSISTSDQPRGNGSGRGDGRRARCGRAGLTSRRLPSSPACSQVNFYSGSPPLNRLSFHRHSSALLNAHLGHHLTLFLALSNGAPLVSSATGQLALLSWAEAGPLLGGGPGNGPWFEEDGEGKARHLQGARLPESGPPLVFLGTDERSALVTERTLLVRDPAPELNKSNPPVFALDASGLETAMLESILKGGGGRDFVDARRAATRFGAWEAGLFAQARSMVDWNGRNKVRLSPFYAIKPSSLPIELAMIAADGICRDLLS